MGEYEGGFRDGAETQMGRSGYLVEASLGRCGGCVVVPLTVGQMVR
jgi:hypothetical protein